MTGLHERLIRDWMTRDPVTVPGSTTVPDAYWLMVEKDIHRLLVGGPGEADRDCDHGRSALSIPIHHDHPQSTQDEPDPFRNAHSAAYDQGTGVH